MSNQRGVSNPNGANQHQPDPRQAEFLKHYLDPKSETFANAKQSGIKAGFSESYSAAIMSKGLEWLDDTVNTELLKQKAEKNLKEFLEMDTTAVKTDSAGGVIEVDDPAMKRIKWDATKFTNERLNKKKYSARTEHTGKDGEEIQIGGFNFIRPEDNQE